MKDKIYKQAKEEFATYKDELLEKGIEDYQFYPLAVMYEITEYFEQMSDEEAEILSKYEHPLDEVYNRWLKQDENLWTDIKEDIEWMGR